MFAGSVPLRFLLNERSRLESCLMRKSCGGTVPDRLLLPALNTLR
jgi:hypothetical protein